MSAASIGLLNAMISADEFRKHHSRTARVASFALAWRCVAGSTTVIPSVSLWRQQSTFKQWRVVGSVAGATQVMRN
jgi:hypothetical protein